MSPFLGGSLFGGWRDCRRIKLSGGARLVPCPQRLSADGVVVRLWGQQLQARLSPERLPDWDSVIESVVHPSWYALETEYEISRWRQLQARDAQRQEQRHRLETRGLQRCTATI